MITNQSGTVFLLPCTCLRDGVHCVAENGSVKLHEYAQQALSVSSFVSNAKAFLMMSWVSLEHNISVELKQTT